MTRSPSPIQKIEQLLTIPDIEKETLFGVIGRMELLLDLFAQHPQYHPLIPFLKTYYLVTKAGAEKYLTFKHYFVSLRDYEVLDINFAVLYFQPLLTYLKTGVTRPPWNSYFNYCQVKNGIPFLQMILGVNAHINTDLYRALVISRYHNEKDFFVVDIILREVTPSVMRFLAFSNHDIFGFAGVFLKQFVIEQVHTVVERWRREAWNNARFTNNENETLMYEKVSQQTEQIAQKLIQDFTDLYNSHLDQFSQIIQGMHKLSVKSLKG